MSLAEKSVSILSDLGYKINKPVNLDIELLFGDNTRCAKEVQHFLKREGIPIKTTHSYEYLARMAGYKNYNTAKAANVSFSKVFNPTQFDAWIGSMVLGTHLADPFVCLHCRKDIPESTRVYLDLDEKMHCSPSCLKSGTSPSPERERDKGRSHTWELVCTYFIPEPEFSNREEREDTINILDLLIQGLAQKYNLDVDSEEFRNKESGRKLNLRFDGSEAMANEISTYFRTQLSKVKEYKSEVGCVRKS